MQALFQGAQIRAVTDQLVCASRLRRWPPDREKRAQYVVLEIEQTVGTLLERTSLDPLVRLFGRAKHVETNIAQIVEEVGYLVIAPPLPEHIVGGKPSLFYGVVPVLDMTALGKDGIEKAGHVPGCVYVG